MIRSWLPRIALVGKRKVTMGEMIRGLVSLVWVGLLTIIATFVCQSCKSNGFTISFSSSTAAPKARNARWNSMTILLERRRESGSYDSSDTRSSYSSTFSLDDQGNEYYPTGRQSDRIVQANEVSEGNAPKIPWYQVDSNREQQHVTERKKLFNSNSRNDGDYDFYSPEIKSARPSDESVVSSQTPSARYDDDRNLNPIARRYNLGARGEDGIRTTRTEIATWKNQRNNGLAENGRKYVQLSSREDASVKKFFVPDKKNYNSFDDDGMGSRRLARDLSDDDGDGMRYSQNRRYNSDTRNTNDWSDNDESLSRRTRRVSSTPFDENTWDEAFMDSPKRRSIDNDWMNDDPTPSTTARRFKSNFDNEPLVPSRPRPPVDRTTTKSNRRSVSWTPARTKNDGTLPFSHDLDEWDTSRIEDAEPDFDNDYNSRRPRFIEENDRESWPIRQQGPNFDSIQSAERASATTPWYSPSTTTSLMNTADYYQQDYSGNIEQQELKYSNSDNNRWNRDQESLSPPNVPRTIGDRITEFPSLIVDSVSKSVTDTTSSILQAAEQRVNEATSTVTTTTTNLIQNAKSNVADVTTNLIDTMSNILPTNTAKNQQSRRSYSSPLRENNDRLESSRTDVSGFRDTDQNWYSKEDEWRNIDNARISTEQQPTRRPQPPPQGSLRNDILKGKGSLNAERSSSVFSRSNLVSEEVSESPTMSPYERLLAAEQRVAAAEKRYAEAVAKLETSSTDSVSTSNPLTTKSSADTSSNNKKRNDRDDSYSYNVGKFTLDSTTTTNTRNVNNFKNEFSDQDSRSRNSKQRSMLSSTDGYTSSNGFAKNNVKSNDYGEMNIFDQRTSSRTPMNRVEQRSVNPAELYFVQTRTEPTFMTAAPPTNNIGSSFNNPLLEPNRSNSIVSPITSPKRIKLSQLETTEVTPLKVTTKLIDSLVTKPASTLLYVAEQTYVETVTEVKNVTNTMLQLAEEQVTETIRNVTTAVKTTAELQVESVKATVTSTATNLIHEAENRLEQAKLSILAATTNLLKTAEQKVTNTTTAVVNTAKKRIGIKEDIDRSI